METARIQNRYGSLEAGPAKKAASRNISSEFSKMLDNMRKGKPADYDEEAASGKNTTTITRVLSDGSVLVTVMQDDQIISQSKTRAANPQENPWVVGTTITKSLGDEVPEAGQEAADGTGQPLPELSRQGAVPLQEMAQRP